MRSPGWYRYLSILMLGVFVLALSLPMVGQERFGNITGIVTDPSGAVVSDVQVTITNKSTNRAITTKTRSDGTYSAFDLEPGRYSIGFQKQGFGRYEVPDVIVLVGRTANVPASMKLGSVDQTVEVVETAPLIDTTSTMIATNVTAEEIEHLPKPRTFQAIAVFSPSVNTGTVEGGFQINGASAAENGYYIDGVATNSIIDGSARQSATFDYIQEVQVKTTGLDAEYGGALGGVVSAITRSGGNAFHGDAHYYYYGSKLSADPPKRLQLDPAAGPLATSADVKYFQDDKGRRDTNEIGGSFGGPILKDRLWFFTALSPRWLSRSVPYSFTDGNTTMERSARQMNWFSKISWNPTDRIRTNFTYLYTPTYQTGSLFAYDDFRVNGSTSDIATARASSRLGFRQAENSVTGQIDFTLSNTSLLSVKGGRYFLNYASTGVDATTQWQWVLGSSIPCTAPDTPTGCNALIPPSATLIQQGEGYASPSAALTANDTTTRAYVQADLSQLVNFGGQHNFKFGIGTQKNINNVNDFLAPNGRVNFFFNTPGSPALFRGLYPSGTYGYYSVDDLGTAGSAGANITHFYVQDSWRLFRRITVNAGVRFEREIIPSFRPDIKKNAFEYGFGDKIGPRIGAAFDVFGNGKLKVSGGWGRYYDWTKFDLARGTFGADYWRVYYRTLDDLSDLYSINLHNLPGTDLWNQYYGEPFRDRRIPGFDTLDPNVKPMSSDTMNAGAEWEVANNMVVSGRWVRSKLNRTIEDMGVLVNGSEAYFYGNPGEGSNTIVPASGATCIITVDGVCGVPMPKAKRQYDAAEFQFTKRFGQGWLASASYVYSRLWGNYSGLQSTDEIRPSGLGYGFGGNQQFAAQLQRPGGNANRYFDLDEAFYDAHGNNGLFGLLPTDRPHVFKIYGAKQFKFGTDIGAFFRVMSGTPVTTQVDSANQIPIYVNGRGDMGRTPLFNQTDLVVGHNFKLGESKGLRLEMNMSNLFNQKTSQFTWDRYTREEYSDSYGIDLSGVDLSKGFDYKALVAASGNDLDPRYGMDAEFNTGFEARFLVKFTF